MQVFRSNTGRWSEIPWNKGKRQNRETGEKEPGHTYLEGYLARIYLSGKEEGRGLITVEDTVTMAILKLERYVLTSEESLLIAAGKMDRDYEQHLRVIESGKEFKERRRDVMCWNRRHYIGISLTKLKKLQRKMAVAKRREHKKKAKNRQDSNWKKLQIV